jgi:diguanylate cyclase (GGDEF)-like protein/PAS domain S-box-containing protein
MKIFSGHSPINYKFLLLLLICVLSPLLILAVSLLFLSGQSALNNSSLWVTLLITGFIAMAVIIGALLIINKQAIDPIQKMMNGLQSIQEGRLAEQRPIRSQGLSVEIGNLVQGYNQFLSLLKTKEMQETALKVSEERYDLAMKGSHDGVWDWDIKTDMCYYSPRWRAILGYTEESIHNSPTEWFSRVHADDLDALKADIKSHLEGKTSHFENEHRLLHANGSYVWVWARGLALFDQQKTAYRFAGSISDNTKRKEFESRLLHDAMHDPLTHLPNREYFLETLGSALGRTHRREDYHAAVIYVDLDRFKFINDGMGYKAGDELLIETSQRLKRTLRLMDTVARIGGDEFCILLEEINGLQDAIQITRRLHKLLTQPIILEKQEFSPNASFGLVMLTRGYSNSEEILQDADTALNQAKANGGGRFEIFDKEMHLYTLSKLKTESELTQAIKKRASSLFPTGHRNKERRN